MLASNVAVAALPGTSIDTAFVPAPDHIGAGCGLSNGVDFITWIIGTVMRSLRRLKHFAKVLENGPQKALQAASSGLLPPLLGGR